MDKLTLYKLAKLYYIDGLGQQEIANVTGFSRPQVSRMLKEARNCRIVDIKLNPPYAVTTESLAEKLSKKLSVGSVNVVDCSEYQERDLTGRMSMLAGFAAEYLAGIIPSCRKVGVGWGRTIYSVVKATEHNYSPVSTRFVPLVGNSGYIEPYYQTNSIVDRLAEKYKATGEFLNTPAFVSTGEMHRYFIEENGLDQPGGIWDNIDLAFFSLGGMPEKSAIVKAIPDKDALQTLIDNNVVGDCLGFFFDANGRSLRSSDKTPHIALPHERLLEIPRRICIAMSEEKAAVIKAAAAMGIFTDLVTDNYTAENILAL